MKGLIGTLLGLPVASAAVAETPYSVTERGADYKVLQRTTVEHGTNRVHRYTELATGMNYTNASGQWMESREQITLLAQGGAAATQGRRTVRFPTDIYNGVIEVVTPDGKHLNSRPLGVSYDDGSNVVWIAKLKHCTGYLVSSNKVLYPDAFTGVKADLICTYRRGGFESDLVFRQQPPAPNAYGLDDSASTLQLFTEFFNTPEPQQIPAADDPNYGISDTTLKFGKMTMTRGRAFLVGNPRSSDGRGQGEGQVVAVYKSWFHAEARTFLVEQLPLEYIADELQTLPPSTNILTAQITKDPVLYVTQAKRRFPPARERVADTNQMLVASVDLNQQPGVVLDYNEINTDQTDFTFLANTTYYLSGGVILGGTTTIQGGAVIKFSNSLDGNTYNYDPASGVGNGALSCDQISCRTDPYHPAIFTSRDDDSVGETIADSAGAPGTLSITFLAETAAYWNNSIAFQNLRFCYANVGVLESAFNKPSFENCQFLNCHIGFAGYGGIVTLKNCLFAGGTGIQDPEFGDGFVLENVTMANQGYNIETPEVALGYLPWYAEGYACALYITNSLFAGGQSLSSLESLLTSLGGTVNDASSADLSGAFQSGPGGNYYLAPDSPHINAGNATADTLGLDWFTTQGSDALEGDSIVDLGYHYPAYDSDHDGLPDWWEMKYFGNLNQDARGTSGDFDGDGVSNLDEYLNGTDPNKIRFSIVAINNYVKTNTVPLQLRIENGAPFSVASLVDSTNLPAATWSTYASSDLSVNLGTNQGWHEVWVGLRGLSTNSQQTWEWKRLKLDLTPPQIVITSPSNVVSQTMIQLLGFSPESLSQISCDLSNATGVLTNQQVLVLDQFYDTNTWEFTTNIFQAFDIDLTNGINTFTFHATDQAGNQTTTNFSFTLVSDTNPPILNLIWPQNAMKLCGDSFTIHGTMDDPSATITAMLVDTNGTTNTFHGLVERNGKFWMENLPLSGGTNFLTLTAVDAWANATTTNFSVSKSTLGLTIDAIDPDRLHLSAISLSGTVSDSSCSVSVNGVGATVASGNWNASGVPVNTGGTASFYVTAAPSGGGGSSSLSTNTDKPWRLYAKSDTQSKSGTSDTVYVDYDANGNPVDWGEDKASFRYNHDWSDGKSGNGSQLGQSTTYYATPSSSGTSTGLCGLNFTWPTSYWETVDSTYGTQTITGDCGPDADSTAAPPLIGMEHCNVKSPRHLTWVGLYFPFENFWEDGFLNETYTRSAQTKMKLYTGGKAVPRRQNLWKGSGSASEILQKRATPKWSWYSDLPTRPIASTDIVLGDFGRLGTNGLVYMALPDDSIVDITPVVAGVDFYTFVPDAQKYLSHFEVLVRMPDPGGTANHTGSSSSGDYGHAWWYLSSDAPTDIIEQQLSTANLNPNAVNRLNVQEGYGHSGSLSVVYSPFDLVGPGVVYGSSGDNTNRTYEIGFNELLGGLDWAQNLTDHPGTYGALHNNCAQNVEMLANTVGVPLPNTRYPEYLGNHLPPNN